jgi:hypothetical protein
MPITYTNRKELTYFLHRGKTKTGKPRYFFSRKDQGELVDEIPAGFEIRESPNGIVSLAKEKPRRIQDSEINLVQAALDKHPNEDLDCRLDVKPDSITVYERVGPAVDELVDIFVKYGFAVKPEGVADVEKMLDQDARYEPVLRFVFEDKEARIFSAERMTYTGRGGWLYLGSDQLQPLVEHLIPLLDTDDFFELD